VTAKHRDEIATVIPQEGVPRWILFGDPRKALPVLNSWRPFYVKSRAKWSIILAATSINALSRLPGVTRESVTIDPSYWRQQIAGYSENWVPVVHVGHSSYTRKAILFFIDENAAVKVVAKVPLTPGAVGAILNEAAVLRRMAALEDLPHILFQDAERGITAQSWLEGKPIERRLTDQHIDLLSKLANEGRTTRLTDYRAAIEASLDELDMPFDRSLLVHALDLLDYDGELPEFVEHRDFAPWNLKRLPGGHLTLLDWEWAVESSLPWQDICRYFYIQDVYFSGSGKVWELLTSNPLTQQYLRRFGIPDAALPGLTMYYLLRVLCMDWKNTDMLLAEYTMKQIKALYETHRPLQVSV
jgi:hypothetical protein